MQQILTKIYITGEPVLLGTIGFSAGLIISFGLVALILGLNLISRFAKMTHTEAYLKLYEICLILGAVLCNLITIYQPDLTLWIDWLQKLDLFHPEILQTIKTVASRCFSGILGLFCGIYLGCWVIALTEVVDMFPILFRKLNIQAGTEWIMISAALGKSLFSILYYLNSWQ